MKILTLLALLFLLGQSHIYSSRPTVTYNNYGYPLRYSLFMSLETGIGSNDYLRIIWPEQIHASTKNLIVVNLVSFSNNLQVATTTMVNQNVVNSNTYHVTFNYALQPNTWYQIQIFPTKNPVLATNNYLVQVLATSDYNTNLIIYDSNLAFGYLDILAPLASNGTLGVICNSSSTQAAIPSSIYTVDIYLTPSISSTTGGNFTFNIYYNSLDAIMNTTGTSLIDFSFMGLCQSTATAVSSAAILLFCTISSDLSTITFSMSSVTAGQTIRITTSVNNPAYYSIRGIQAYWVEFISGRIIENGLQNNALGVNKISVNTIANRIQLLWGIDSAYTDSYLPSGMPLFKATSTNINQYNSFNIGFSFTQTSPISGQYTVKMTINAQGVLEGSIAHNLPSYQSTPVYCYYDTTNKQIVCNNVGSFINTNYRYFISGKAFFSSATGNLTTFGDVYIYPIAYDSAGNLLGSAQLYTALTPGSTIVVQSSQEFLDTNGGGYHDTNSKSIGNAQVVSFLDDGTLSSTANAMLNFLQGTNSTIGVVPGLGTSQQLLFLLKTPSSIYTTGATASHNLTTLLLYNNKVISFQSTAAGRGLDFVGYQNSTGVWSISLSPCYANDGPTVMCQKYNNDTPTVNINTQMNYGAALNSYGVYSFKCGDGFLPSSPCASDCAFECAMWTGYSTSDQGASIMAMRQVVFPSGYHSSLYADSNVLDFVLMFMRGNTIVSYALINAYTMTGADMQNIKAAYVNYYDNTNGVYNKGVRIPMMIRIGGGVLPSESLSATVVGVFFDDNVDASTFYTSTGTSFAIGCSTGSCVYFPNKGINNIRNDNWHTNRRVMFYNIPPIQNEFNLLVPVTPDTTNRNPPKFFTIAFFAQNYSVGGQSGYLQTVSVYRIYGPIVTASIAGGIPYINGLSRVSSGSMDIDFKTSGWTTSNSFWMSLNTTNMYSNALNNTFTYGNNDAVSTFGTYFGGGYTITSLFYNIFASSTVQFDSPPANTATTCSIFGYLYNEIQNVGANPQRDKQFTYVAYCPIDSTFNLGSAAANINFLNPQYPTILTNGFPLRSILTLAYSSQPGNLRAYRHQTNSISTFVRSCTTAKLQPYNPSSTGKQRATFTISTPAITMSATGYSGYKSFWVKIDIPSSTVASSNLQMSSTQCDVSISSLACTIYSGGNSVSTTLTLTYTGTGTSTATITYFELGLYATASGAFAAASAYNATLILPQYISANSDYSPFGPNFNSQTTYALCSSSFTVGITAYGQNMVFSNLVTSSMTNGVRSSIAFNFGASSYRDSFFTSSTFVFNYGFLANPASTYIGRNNFRCMVFQNGTLSNQWKTLSLSSLSSVTLTPKAEISNPASILYTMQCYGGAVPTGTNSTAMSLIWSDSATVQASNTISLPGSYFGSPGNTVTFSIVAKRFKTAGFKSLYSFSVTSNVALTINTMLYFDFHMNLNSKLDSEGVVECYTRTSLAIVDSQALYTYCQFTNQWQLQVWNNRVVAANTAFYVDIYNVEQPNTGDITNNQYIALTLDNDNNYLNGVLSWSEIRDNTVNIAASTAKNIKILTSTLSTNYIRTPQNITITLDTLLTNVFATVGTNLYVLFPSAYSQWINRANTITTITPANSSAQYCSVVVTGLAVNLATACTFISQRMLKITLASVASNNLFTLSLLNIMSPSTMPSGKYNQFRFKLFVSDSSENYITYYSFTDQSAALTLTSNPLLIDLAWIYRNIAVSDSLISLPQITGQVITIQTGYYSAVIELRQSLYPSNYQTPMQLLLSSLPASSFSYIGGSLNISLGYASCYFRIAANNILSAGLYTLQFSKTGDPAPLYTNIPPLTLVVNSQTCTLTTDAASYTLPMGGTTLPIIIDAIKCIPTASINITVTFTSSEFKVSTDLSSLVLTSASPDGKLYIVIQHIPNTLPVGSTVTATLTVIGPNAPFYSSITPIQLTLVDATTFQTYPTATALSAPTLLANTAMFTLQCSATSLIYWGLGIYPSILNTQALDFQARIISTGNGLQTNYTESNDYFGKVYGIKQGTTMQVLTKTLYNLKSNTNYIFKYYCMNQLGHISDGQSINFTSLNYGAYLMKVSITFRSSITYAQYNSLACSLAQNFIIPYLRVMTEAMSSCANTPYIFYSADNTTILNQPDSNGDYIYGFYILPDYTQSADTTNANIRNQLSLNSFTTTVITSTSNYIGLPSLVQMQTQDIQIFTTPIITVSSPISGLNSVVLTASITNMNGFVVMGILAGAFNSTNQTLPSTINIKNGQFSSTQALLSTRMIYATQNYNMTIAFGSLSANTVYNIFYFCTAEDPQVTGLSSSVSYVTAQTLQVLVIDINWGATLTILCLTVLALIF